MLAELFKNNDSRDCSICFNETNGLKMNYHQFWRYQRIWHDNDNVIDQPLIKCIKCNIYTCQTCKFTCQKQYGGCPQNCHEIGQPKTPCHQLKIYYKYGLNKNLNYCSSNSSRLWLLQDIYEYQETPNIQGFKIPSSNIQVQEALEQTRLLYDKISINWTNQSIIGYIKLPFDQEPIKIEYLLYLVVSDDSKYQSHHVTPVELLQCIKQQFKQDIEKFFEEFSNKNTDLYKHGYNESFTQIQQQNKPINGQSVFELGYTDYIRRCAKYWICPKETVYGFKESEICIDHYQIMFQVNASLNSENLIPYYRIQLIDMRKYLQYPSDMIIQVEQICTVYNLCEDYEKQARWATKAEFDEFFKEFNQIHNDTVTLQQQ